MGLLHVLFELYGCGALASQLDCVGQCTTLTALGGDDWTQMPRSKRHVHPIPQW
jgi:hypothetical protein